MAASVLTIDRPLPASLSAAAARTTSRSPGDILWRTLQRPSDLGGNQDHQYHNQHHKHYHHHNRGTRRPDWSTSGLPFGSLLRTLDPTSSTSSPSTSELFMLRQELDWCNQISSWNDVNVSVRLTRHIRRMMSTQTGNGRLSKSSSEGPVFPVSFHVTGCPE